jgi:hypothetical protein
LPENLLTTGLPTNPVHVIDLAIILPGIFMTGIMLIKKQPDGLSSCPGDVGIYFAHEPYDRRFKCRDDETRNRSEWSGCDPDVDPGGIQFGLISSF